MNKLRAKKTLLSAAISLVLASSANQAFASAFQLQEENGVGAGTYGAGAAAIAFDASTAYYNPAGLTFLDKPQLATSIDPIFIKMDFAGRNVWQSTVFPGFTFQQAGTATGGKNILIPALNLAYPLRGKLSNFAFGFSATVPFGLSTQWGGDTIVRYNGTKSYVTDLDLSPVIAYRFNDHFSIGAGVDEQYLTAELDQVVGVPPISIGAGLTTGASLLPNTFDSLSTNKAHGWGTGWHAGIMYQMHPGTRFGLTYHSETDINVHGSSVFQIFPNLALTQGFASVSSGNLSSKVKLPGYADLSAYHDMTDTWAVMASVIYTWWHRTDIIVLNNVAGFLPVSVTSTSVTGIPFFTSAALPLDYTNTWRASVGTQVKLTDKFTMRMGVGYDETPTKLSTRTIRLPDASRFATAIGGSYQFSPSTRLDLGWTHLFIQNGLLNAPTILNGPTFPGAQISSAFGSTTNSVNVVGVQLNWALG